MPLCPLGPAGPFPRVRPRGGTGQRGGDWAGGAGCRPTAASARGQHVPMGAGMQRGPPPAPASRPQAGNCASRAEQAPRSQKWDDEDTEPASPTACVRPPWNPHSPAAAPPLGAEPEGRRPRGALIPSLAPGTRDSRKLSPLLCRPRTHGLALPPPPPRPALAPPWRRPQTLRAKGPQRPLRLPDGPPGPLVSYTPSPPDYTRLPSGFKAAACPECGQSCRKAWDSGLGQKPSTGMRLDNGTAGGLPVLLAGGRLIRPGTTGTPASGGGQSAKAALARLSQGWVRSGWGAWDPYPALPPLMSGSPPHRAPRLLYWAWPPAASLVGASPESPVPHMKKNQSPGKILFSREAEPRAAEL